MAASERLHNILNRLAAAEEEFLAREFLAPVPPGGQVQVRIAGVVCRLKVEPADFAGWGVFRPQGPAVARLVRPARLAERQRYLELFPRLRLILGPHAQAPWPALPAHQGDHRFRIQGTVPVHLVEGAQPFEVVEARFDGVQAWFERLDPRHDPAAAAYLRRAFEERVEPEQLSRPGLTAEERAAYALAYGPRARAEEQARRDQAETRLRQALAHAGADFRGYREHDDAYRVEYEVDGRGHVSVVSKHDLSVLAAGICLSGADEHFDLQSLVGVLREGERESGLVWLDAGE